MESVDYPLHKLDAERMSRYFGGGAGLDPAPAATIRDIPMWAFRGPVEEWIGKKRLTAEHWDIFSDGSASILSVVTFPHRCRPLSNSPRLAHWCADIGNLTVEKLFQERPQLERPRWLPWHSEELSVMWRWLH